MINTKHFKQKLEEEKEQLEKILSGIAKPDPENPDDWKTTPDDLNVMTTDQSEMADVFEESQNKEARERETEERLNKVKDALKRIEDNSYGMCTEGCKIEEKRLEADPTATTCIKHKQ